MEEPSELVYICIFLFLFTHLGTLVLKESLLGETRLMSFELKILYQVVVQKKARETCFRKGVLIDEIFLPVYLCIGFFSLSHTLGWKYDTLWRFRKMQRKFVLGRGFANEESGFLIDQNVLLVSINYRFFRPKFGRNANGENMKISNFPDFNACTLILNMIQISSSLKI